jgi:hypothetical protein
MAYFHCNFHGFPLRCAASAKLLKKLQFPSYNDAQHLLSGGVRSVFLAFPPDSAVTGVLTSQKGVGCVHCDTGRQVLLLCQFAPVHFASASAV